MEKYFDNITLGEYLLTGVSPIKVYVEGRYLILTDTDDIEDPLYGFGMMQTGEMVPFDYRLVDHILVGDQSVTLKMLNKSAEKKEEPESKGEEAPEEAPEEEKPAKEKKKEESVKSMKLSNLIKEKQTKSFAKNIQPILENIFGTAKAQSLLELLTADQQKYWALFGDDFYEKLFSKVRDLPKLQQLYDKLKQKLHRKDAVDAVDYFYDFRKKELGIKEDSAADKKVEDAKEKYLKAKMQAAKEDLANLKKGLGESDEYRPIADDTAYSDIYEHEDEWDDNGYWDEDEDEDDDEELDFDVEDDDYEYDYEYDGEVNGDGEYEEDEDEWDETLGDGLDDDEEVDYEHWIEDDEEQDVTAVSEPYTIKVGDLVHNTDCGCKHYGSKGFVISVEPGDMIRYSITNSGPFYKLGDIVTKNMSALESI